MSLFELYSTAHALRDRRKKNEGGGKPADPTDADIEHLDKVTAALAALNLPDVRI